MSNLRCMHLFGWTCIECYGLKLIVAPKIRSDVCSVHFELECTQFKRVGICTELTSVKTMEQKILSRWKHVVGFDMQMKILMAYR